MLSRHQDPGHTISYLWHGPPQCRLGTDCCYELHLVGAGGLPSCQPESPADLSAKSYWRCCCRGVPSSSISHLGSAPQRAGPRPFYKLPITSVISVLTGNRGPPCPTVFPAPHLCRRLRLGPLPAPLSGAHPPRPALPFTCRQPTPVTAQEPAGGARTGGGSERPRPRVHNAPRAPPVLVPSLLKPGFSLGTMRNGKCWGPDGTRTCSGQ